MPASLIPTFTGRSWESVWAYTACVWALLFTIPHVYWAVGGTAGLAGHSMTGMLLIVNLVAIPLLLIAAGVALCTVQSLGQMIPRWVLLPTVWGASVVLSVRGIGGLVQRSLSSGHIGNQPLLSLFADPWFVLGGVLFGMTAWAYTRKLRDQRAGTFEY